MYGNITSIQTAAASRTGQIPNYLDTDPVCQDFNRVYSNPVQLSLTRDRAVGYYQVQDEFTIGKRTSRAS